MWLIFGSSINLFKLWYLTTILKYAPFFLLGPGHNPMAHATPVAGNAAAQEDRTLREPPPSLQRQGAAERRRQEPLQVSSLRVVASAPGTAAIATLLALAAATLAALRVDQLDRHVPAFPILRTKKKLLFKGDFFSFFLFLYDIQHCTICRPSD